MVHVVVGMSLGGIGWVFHITEVSVPAPGAVCFSRSLPLLLISGTGQWQRLSEDRAGIIRNTHR